MLDGTTNQGAFKGTVSSANEVPLIGSRDPLSFLSEISLNKINAPFKMQLIVQ